MSYEAAFDKASHEISARDPVAMAHDSGVEYRDGRFELSFFNRTFTISYPDIKIEEPGGKGEVPAWLQLALLHYLIQAGGVLPATFHCPTENLRGDEWIVYRQLPGASSAGGVFQRTVINPLIQAFGQDVEGFKQACTSLGGRYLSKSGDAAFTFLALPRLPMAVVLYLGEEGMLPSVNVLFDATAAEYLPSEDLILIGEYLSAALLQRKGLKSPSSVYLF
jgi:hypothetical protein